jgi:hypothetical protein
MTDKSPKPRTVRTYETLEEYIDRVHEGNKSAYARAIKKTPQHVRKMIDRGDIVIDGELYGKRGW